MKTIALLLLSMVTLRGQTPDTVFLEDLTWTELRTLIQGGTTTVLFPTGGTEQNGPHMVLGKHNYRARYAAEQIARKLGKTLVAPVVSYAPQGEINMKYPGTIDLPDEYWRKLVEHAARSLKRHGFKHIVILRDSGSDTAKLTALVDGLNSEWAKTDCRIHFIQEYRMNGFDEWLLQQGESTADIGQHAGILDTSLLMAIDPKHIRHSKLSDRAAFEGSVNGNPERATVEYGKKGLQLMIDAAVASIQKATIRSRRNQ